MKEIAILTGGDSNEYEISIQSAKIVLNNLNKEKYNGTIIHLKNGVFTTYSDNKKINTKDLTITINESKIQFDFVFIALHGPPAENGDIQKLFDKLKIPYSSCSSSISEMTFNKFKCNNKLKELGFNCANSLLYIRNDHINNDYIIKELKLPVFVKPNQSGSSLGISKVKKKSDLKSAIQEALLFDEDIIIEEYINGIELSCGVLRIKKKIITLPITEIISENEFFDYKAKYEGMSQEITPAKISEEIAINIRKITTNIYEKLDLRGVCRIDFILKNKIPYIIEINTIPGLSQESIIPKQAKEAGISLKELFDYCIENTIE